jgi:hypothetical protein
MTILVAAPTYVGKDYALPAYLAAYEAFTYPEKRLFLVDNTRGTLAYARRLRGLGIETAHVEPMPDFWDTIEMCWRVIVERAHDLDCEHVACIEADVICPPQTLEVLLAHADGTHPVMAGVPQHDAYHFDMWTTSCALLRTDWLHESRYLWPTGFEVMVTQADPVPLKGLLVIDHLEDADEPPWRGGEGKVFGSGRG